MRKPQTFWQKLWQDKTGRQALIAPPNIPLISWAAFMIIGWLLPIGRLETATQFVSAGFLFTWAWLEIYDGKAYLRRLLGLVVLSCVILSHLK
jgi:hypothetical protein